MDELDLRIRTHIYGSFVFDGRARTAGETAAELGLDESEVAGAYRRLHDAHALVLVSGPNEIRMLNPFSAVETPHRVQAGDRSWFANCAWDALGIPAALHVDGSVCSECPDCGEPLELEVRDGLLSRGAELLVHFVVPARRWWDDIGFTWRTMVFLRSEEHLEHWLGRNGWEPGASLSATALHELAQRWWRTRLDPDWRPRTPDESQAILDELGLTGEFWQLT